MRFAFLLLGSTLVAACGSASPLTSIKPSSTVFTTTTSQPVTVPFTVADLGVTIAGAADPTAILLPDGRVRLYYAASPPGEAQASAIASDGVHFTVEPRSRLTSGYGVAGPHMRIVRLADGRWRLFFNTAPRATAQGIGSAISSDGLTFAVEPGLRITVAAAGVGPDLSTGDVVAMPDGRYRMYFSSFSYANDGTGILTVNVVRSAVSSDLLTWTVDPGVRIGAGAPFVTGSGEHPAALLNADGSVSLFYGRRSPIGGLLVATSRDGLMFSSEWVLIGQGDFGQMGPALDSAVVRLADGTILLYHSDRDNAAGVNMVKIKRLTPANA